jgi:hypothetical protein
MQAGSVTFPATSSGSSGSYAPVTYLGRVGGMAETLGRLFHVFGQAYGVFLTITTSAYLAIWAVTWVLVGLAAALIASLANKSNAGEDDYGYEHSTTATTTGQNSDALNVLGLLGFEVVLGFVIFYIIMCAADGAIIRAVTELYVGKSPHALTAIAAGFRKLGPLLGVTFLLGACVIFPVLFLLVKIEMSDGAQHARLMLFCVLVIVAWVGVVTYHIYAVIMVEGLGVCGSLRRSFDLSSGHRCYIFTTLFVYGLLKAVPMGVVKALLSSHGTGAISNDSKGNPIILSLLDMMLKILFASLGSM